MDDRYRYVPPPGRCCAFDDSGSTSTSVERSPPNERLDERKALPADECIRPPQGFPSDYSSHQQRSVRVVPQERIVPSERGAGQEKDAPFRDRLTLQPRTQPTGKGSESSRLDKPQETDKTPPPIHPRYQAAAVRRSVFDRKELLDDILFYLENGTSILKHGRSGMPHERFFFLFRRPPSHAGGSPIQRLCWVAHKWKRQMDEEATNYVDLNSVYDITLGQSTEVFGRSSSANTDDPTFYTSFSLHYMAEDENRTLDLVCGCVPEMEAWVAGICSLCKRNPRFAVPLALCSKAEACRCLTAEELELTRRWHVPPALITSLHQRIDDLNRLLNVAAITVYVGGFRYFSDVDIFRASALMHYFASIGKIVVAPPAVDYLDWQHH